jgi:hypothetical protein
MGFQEDDMVEVNVWKANNGNVGHCSLTVYADDAHRTTYISWWPERDYGPSDLLLNSCVQRARKSKRQDESAEGGSPLVVPVSSLDEDAIVSYWRRLLADTTKQYCGQSLNCATIVYRALRAGGAPELPEAEHSVCSPGVLWTYAMMLSNFGTGNAK